MLIPVTAKVLMLSIGCISGRLIVIGRRERIGWDKTDGGTERQTEGAGRETWNVSHRAPWRRGPFKSRSFTTKIPHIRHTAYKQPQAGGGGGGSTGGGLSVSLSSLKPIRTGRISKLRIRRDPIGFLKKRSPAVCVICLICWLGQET